MNHVRTLLCVTHKTLLQNQQAVRVLLEGGADVNAADNNGSTALFQVLAEFG